MHTHRAASHLTPTCTAEANPALRLPKATPWLPSCRMHAWHGHAHASPAPHLPSPPQPTHPRSPTTHPLPPLRYNRYNNRVVKIRVMPGPEGLVHFQQQVRALLGLELTEAYDVSFETTLAGAFGWLGAWGLPG